MKNKESWKRSGLLLIVLIVVGTIVWGIFTGMDRRDLDKTLEETTSFTKIKLKDYEDYTANDRVKSLIRLLDKSKELTSNMSKIDPYGQEELDAYVTDQRLSGAFVLDESQNVVLQSPQDVDILSLWREIINKDYIKEILDHPEETYTERVLAGGTLYDLAVVSRQDAAGLLFTYVEKSSKNVDDITLSSVFADFPISMDGVIAVCKENRVVSTNQAALLGKTFGELQEEYGSRLNQQEDGIIRIKSEDGTWYGHKDSLGEYLIYIFFPLSQVFLTRSVVCGVYLAIAVFLYLLLLLVQSNMEKTVLKQNQKRMRIINALGTAYSSIALLDLNTNEAEIIKKAVGDDSFSEGKLVSNPEQKKQISNWITEEYREEFMKFADMSTMAQRLKENSSLTCTVQLETGNWILSLLVPQRYDRKGNIIAVLLANRDVTRERERELEQEKTLRDALAVAEHANQAKTNFLNSISHDIRTPMNAVIGFTSLAMAHADNRKMVLDYLGKIDVSSRHLLSLINDVLDMSRIESGIVKLEEVNVHLPDILDGLQSIIQGDICAKQQEFYIDTAEIVHEDFVTDKLRLNQVLLNVVSNAVKFTPVGGRISIHVSEKPCGREGYASYSFQVKDNGIGMSEEFQKHVFDAFEREQTVTKSGIQGTGLGMAISRNIIHMMGGTIQVNSEAGKGSEFIITIECRISETKEQISRADERKAETDAKEQYRHAGKKILLVEDNELNREIATAILEEAGILVEAVEDGADAVARMNSAEESRYDLILMDVQMPKMDGYTATREIRTLGNNRKANIPIVAMTANAFEEDKKKAFEAGMNGHISKPINIEMILHVMDQIFPAR